MSTESAPIEEDNELRDMVANLLEKNGTLAKIRAQLRASVFLALDDKEDAMKNQPLMNQSMKKFLVSEDGRLCMSMVWEFMEFFNLDYSLSVFSRESYGLGPVANENNNGGNGSGILYKGRENLREKLGLLTTEVADMPILGEVLSRLKKCDKPADSSPENREKLAASSSLQLSTSANEPSKRGVLGDLPPLVKGRGNALPPLGQHSPGNATGADKLLSALTGSKGVNLGESKVFGDDSQEVVVLGKEADVLDTKKADGSVGNDSSVVEELDEELSISDLLNSGDGGDEDLMTSVHTVSNSSGDDDVKFYAEKFP